MHTSPALNWRQIRTLTSASIKSRYRNTFAGLLWVVLSPLLMYSAQGYVFKNVLGIRYTNYPLFLLTGLMPWIFLNQSVGMATGLFVMNARLLKSFPIHPLVQLLSILLDNLINFVLTFVIIFTVLIFFGNSANLLHFLILPIPFVALFGAVVGLCWFLATLQVFFHDVRFITDFVLSILFFLTPIFYPRSFVPPSYQWLITINPIAMLLDPIQQLSQDTLPGDFMLTVAKSFAVAITFLFLAWRTWRNKKNAVYFRL